MTAAAAAPLRIVAIGASNTQGWYVGKQGAYPAKLQALLKAKGIDAQVINAGVPFDTTAGMLKRIDSDVPTGTDIVILQPGANDRRFLGTKEQRAANILYVYTRPSGNLRRIDNAAVEPAAVAGDVLDLEAKIRRTDRSAVSRLTGKSGGSLEYPPLHTSRTVDLGEARAQEIPQVDDRYPDHVERPVSANILCELVSPEAFFLLVRLCGASSPRIHFGTVMNDRSNSGQIRVPPICA